MKYKVTIELDGYSANEVASKFMAMFYEHDVDADSLDVELLPPSSSDIQMLVEAGDAARGDEVFHFPRTKELLDYLNGPRD